MIKIQISTKNIKRPQEWKIYDREEYSESKVFPTWEYEQVKKDIEGMEVLNSSFINNIAISMTVKNVEPVAVKTDGAVQKIVELSDEQYSAICDYCQEENLSEVEEILNDKLAEKENEPDKKLEMVKKKIFKY